MKNVHVIAPALLLILTACVKKSGPPDKSLLGLDYYPVIKGKFVIYDVDSTVYTDLPKDTIYYRYRIKEKFTDNFTDNEGNTAWRLERYIKHFDPSKPYDSIPFTIKVVWMVNADERRVQVMENNIRFTKLAFPVERHASWNGNAQNSHGERMYSYEYIENGETINKTQFTNVLKVKQVEFPTLISDERASERYAKGVGLVAREITNILSNKIVADKPVADRIESGIIYKQLYVAHGIE